jgi:hypothetical protein
MGNSKPDAGSYQDFLVKKATDYQKICSLKYRKEANLPPSKDMSLIKCND